MPLEISGRIHSTAGSLPRGVSLPDLPGSTQWSPPMADRIGEAVQSWWPAIGLGGVGGAVLGSKLLRRSGGGWFKGLVGGALGLVAGVGLLTGGIGLLRPTSHHDAPTPAAGSVTPDVEVHEREHVKVMTYNVHGGMGGPGAYFSSSKELDALAKVIRDEDPDVVILQEVDNFAPRSNWRDTLSELSDRLDPESAVGATGATNVTGRDQHVAVMTFHGFKVEDARDIVHPDPRGGGVGVRMGSMIRDLKAAVGYVLHKDWKSDDPGYEIRNSLDTIVKTPKGTDLRVVGGHYEGPRHDVDHQQRQVGDLAKALSAWSGPTIWGADFNVSSGSAQGESERALMAQAGLTDSFVDRGIEPGDGEHRSASPSGNDIDRIYHSAHSTVEDVHVVRDAWASDHRAVVAELELQPDPPSGDAGN